MSVDTIRSEMLAGIPDHYQKTIGFPTYDLIHGFAIGADALDSAIRAEAEKLDVDNLTGDILTRFVQQFRGIDRRAATHAGGTLTVTGTGTVPQGSLFESTGGIQYRAIQTVPIAGTGTVPVQAVQAGPGGNLPAQSVTQIPVTIQGIVSVTNPAPMLGGYAEEDDDTLRARYYTAVREPPTSGNAAHYKSWALECAGVGGVKVFPLAQGNWTVDVVIVADGNKAADRELVGRVQTYIDPESKGLGDGAAPIGAHAYVTSATEKPIAITATLTLDDPETIESIRTEIKRALGAYLAGLAFDGSVTSYVSYAQIGGILLDVAGVRDHSGLTVGGGTSNIVLGARETAVLGEVTLHVG